MSPNGSSNFGTFDFASGREQNRITLEYKQRIENWEHGIKFQTKLVFLRRRLRRYLQGICEYIIFEHLLKFGGQFVLGYTFPQKAYPDVASEDDSHLRLVSFVDVYFGTEQ